MRDSDIAGTKPAIHLKRAAAPPLDVAAVVREALCYELGYEPGDLADDVEVWSIGVDSLDFVSLQFAVEDGLDIDFRIADWHRQTVEKPKLTVKELIDWCASRYRDRANKA